MDDSRRDELESEYLRRLFERDAAIWRARREGDDKLIDRDAVVGTADVRYDGPRLMDAAE
jgi:hypothetical protein